MLLEDRTAVVYGAGSIGGAVARAFAREGARVFIAGRNRERLDAVADAIHAGDGAVETAEIDALDAAAVDAHADEVAARSGGIDVSFNLITHGDVQGTPMAEMDVDDYVRPVATAVRTMFLTAQAAARHMIPRGSGAATPSARSRTGRCSGAPRRSPTSSRSPRSSPQTARAR